MMIAKYLEVVEDIKEQLANGALLAGNWLSIYRTYRSLLNLIDYLLFRVHSKHYIY